MPNRSNLISKPPETIACPQCDEIIQLVGSMRNLDMHLGSAKCKAAIERKSLAKKDKGKEEQRTKVASFFLPKPAQNVPSTALPPAAIDLQSVVVYRGGTPSGSSADATQPVVLQNLTPL
jgi:hypothetical protein